MNILNMTALETGAAIKNGKISSPEVVRQVLDAAETGNGKTNAYIILCREKALKRAEEVQKKIKSGELLSPLAGVPFSVKDNICTRGVKTTCASRMLENFEPVYNATVIDELEKAGAVIIGKLNMDEFAMGSTSETSYFGTVRNPWNNDRVAGGSSGGAAAAVSGKMALATLGTDTGGSVRQPAAYCGVTGFKPSYGTVSRFGLIAYASSFDQIGPIAHDAADCAAIMNIISGKDKKDGTSLDINYPDFLSSLTGDVKGVRIGIPAECYSNPELDTEVAEKTMAAVSVLQKSGACVEEFSLPFFDYAVPAYYIIASAEASSNLSRYDGVKYGFRSDDSGSLSNMYCDSRSMGFGSEVKRRIILGTFVLSSGYYDAYYQKALKVKSVIMKKTAEIFSKYDLVMCPVSPATAPETGKSLVNPLKMYISDIYTVWANLAGLPAISLPCGFDSAGMPLGVQIIGPALSDVKVLDAAHAYQKHTDFHKKYAGVK